MGSQSNPTEIGFWRDLHRNLAGHDISTRVTWLNAAVTPLKNTTTSTTTTYVSIPGRPTVDFSTVDF